MDSKQWSPSNSGANRGRASRRRSAAGARWSAAFSCLGVGAASAWGRGRPAGEARHVSRADEEEERPAAEMSAGDELRMEKARILSMVWSVTDDAPADGNRQRWGSPFLASCGTVGFCCGVLLHLQLQLRLVCARACRLLVGGCCSAPSCLATGFLKDPCCPRGRRDEEGWGGARGRSGKVPARTRSEADSRMVARGRDAKPASDDCVRRP